MVKTAQVEVTGLDEVLKSLQAAPDQIFEELKKTLMLEANLIYEQSQVLVPKDTRELMRSGQVRPRVEGNRIVIDIGYGSTAVGYALIVHENMDPKINWTTPGTGPKYLERPFNERTSNLGERLARRLRQKFNR